MRFALVPPEAAEELIAGSGMPPNLKEFWLPGGQSYQGVPNIENENLRRILREKKAPLMGKPGPSLPPI
jgi:hypothetical protein